MGPLRSRVAAVAAFASLTAAVPGVVQAQSAGVPFAG